MGGATAADYAWLRDRWTDGVGTTTLCVNFVASLSPGEALRRFGVTPGTSGDYTIAAYEATGGTVLAQTGWATSNSRQYDPLSACTKAATVYVDIKGDEFTCEVNDRDAPGDRDAAVCQRIACQAACTPVRGACRTG